MGALGAAFGRTRPPRRPRVPPVISAPPLRTAGRRSAAKGRLRFACPAAAAAVSKASGVRRPPPGFPALWHPPRSMPAALRSGAAWGRNPASVSPTLRATERREPCSAVRGTPRRRGPPPVPRHKTARPGAPRRLQRRPCSLRRVARLPAAQVSAAVQRRIASLARAFERRCSRRGGTTAPPSNAGRGLRAQVKPGGVGGLGRGISTPPRYRLPMRHPTQQPGRNLGQRVGGLACRRFASALSPPPAVISLPADLPRCNSWRSTARTSPPRASRHPEAPQAGRRRVLRR